MAPWVCNLCINQLATISYIFLDRVEGAPAGESSLAKRTLRFVKSRRMKSIPGIRPRHLLSRKEDCCHVRSFTRRPKTKEYHPHLDIVLPYIHPSCFLTMTSETDEKKAADDTSKKVAELAAKMNTMAKPVFDAIVYAIPIIIKYYHMLRVMIEQLPSTAFNALVGFIFCFFGGLYPVLFAAVQAAEHSGRKAVMDSVSVLSQEVMKIIEESKKDDQIDYDKDGKADVGQMETKEFVQRKLLLVLSKMDPNKIDTAISSIYKVWLAVAAVLTIEFAQTIALALSIADFIKQPVNRYLTPLVQKIIPDKYDKWVPVVLGW